MVAKIADLAAKRRSISRKVGTAIAITSGGVEQCGLVFLPASRGYFGAGVEHADSLVSREVDGGPCRSVWRGDDVIRARRYNVLG